MNEGLARGLGLRGGYSFTTTEVTQDTSGVAGRDRPNAPRHKAELWMRYRVPHGFFEKLMVAGGVIYVAERFTVHCSHPATTELHFPHRR